MSEMPNEQNSPPISEILRKVTADIEAGAPIGGEVAPLPDPSPTPMAVHHEKLESMINTACAVALESTRLAIEREHSVMRAIQQKRDHLHDMASDYLRSIEAVMNHGQVVQDAFTELEREFTSPTVIEPPAGKPSKGNGKRG